MSEKDALIAEARHILSMLKHTVEPQRHRSLKNAFYDLSDQIFPEAAQLREQYKKLQGLERQNLKRAYILLVHELWEKMNPIPFPDDPASIDPSSPPPYAETVKSSKFGGSFIRTASIVVVVAAVCGVVGGVKVGIPFLNTGAPPVFSQTPVSTNNTLPTQPESETLNQIQPLRENEFARAQERAKKQEQVQREMQERAQQLAATKAQAEAEVQAQMQAEAQTYEISSLEATRRAFLINQQRQAEAHAQQQAEQQAQAEAQAQEQEQRLIEFREQCQEEAVQWMTSILSQGAGQADAKAEYDKAANILAAAQQRGSLEEAIKAEVWMETVNAFFAENREKFVQNDILRQQQEINQRLVAQQGEIDAQKRIDQTRLDALHPSFGPLPSLSPSQKAERNELFRKLHGFYPPWK